ncbi:hypothetical protein [Desulfotruncus arcticus]|nr:hypothetical protein [Desulfotruncus arcticus]
MLESRAAAELPTTTVVGEGRNPSAHGRVRWGFFLLQPASGSGRLEPICR